MSGGVGVRETCADKALKHMIALSAWPDAPPSFFGLLFLDSFSLLAAVINAAGTIVKSGDSGTEGT